VVGSAVAARRAKRSVRHPVHPTGYEDGYIAGMRTMAWLMIVAVLAVGALGWAFGYWWAGGFG
jgi:hypothetical protein